MHDLRDGLRATVSVYLDVFDFEPHENIDHVILRLRELKAKHPEYLSLHINLGYHGCDGHSDVRVEIYGDRLETDEEYHRRKGWDLREAQEEEERQQLIDELDRKEYERLKAKFG